MKFNLSNHTEDLLHAIAHTNSVEDLKWLGKRFAKNRLADREGCDKKRVGEAYLKRLRELSDA